MSDQPSGSRWAVRHTVFLLVIVVAMILVGLAPGTGPERVGAWLAELVLLGLFTVVIGDGVTGRAAGILIGERNAMSLARLQLVLWTLVVLSAFFAAALGNLAQGVADPLAIEVPQDLWWLMGISTTSLVGSPLILSNKRTKNPEKKEKDRTMELLAANDRRSGKPVEKRKVQGHLVVNASPEDARLSDVFRGEEVGNAGTVDLGKVQMFYFTLIVVLSYGVALGATFLAGGAVDEFPTLDESLIALLGISHAGYLGHKAVSHSAPPGSEQSGNGDQPADPRGKDGP